jgi:hypothetical protein
MMPTPHVDVQQALVNAWLNADQAMRLREREIGELQKLKSALMDDLLTGRVRVPESVEG